MAQKFELGEKVYGFYDGMMCGTIKSFLAERLENGSILETYNIEFVWKEKKECCTLRQSQIFNTEEDAVNDLLDRLGVSIHLRFKKEEL